MNSSQVNMPLLRLLHQISNMYQNVKDTQVELRSQTKISHSQNKHTSSSGKYLRGTITALILREFNSKFDKISLDAESFTVINSVLTLKQHGQQKWPEKAGLDAYYQNMQKQTFG